MPAEAGVLPVPLPAGNAWPQAADCLSGMLFPTLPSLSHSPALASLPGRGCETLPGPWRGLHRCPALGMVPRG